MDLLFAKTVWLPIDVTPLQTFGGGDIIPLQTFRGGCVEGVRRRSPKGKPPGGGIPMKSHSPWVRVGAEEPQLYLLAPVNGPRNVMRRQTAWRPPPFVHLLVRLNLFLVVGLQGRMLRGENEVASPPQRFGGGRLLLLKEDALVPVPFPLQRFGGGWLILLVIALLARLLGNYRSVGAAGDVWDGALK